MKRLITFLSMSIVLFLVILFGTHLLGSAVWNARASADAPADAPKEATMTSMQDGVEIMVERIERTDNETTVEIDLNNHSYDLASMDIQHLSSFGGQAPERYVIQSSAMGGHHISAALAFRGSPTGELIIGLRDDLVFTFPNL